MKVFIMRGLPGSGKSTWIERYLIDPIICSADHYHTTNGVYKFDPANAGKAHAACLKKFLTHVSCAGDELDIVIDNTNTSLVELAPYVRICQALEIDYEIVHLNCLIETAIERGVHAVPITTMLLMQGNLLTERLPADWKMRFVQCD